MSQALVECIPNFSEGRRREVVDDIAGAISGTPRVRVLDVHMDADHNRSVITFVGPPDGAAQAAFSAIRRAAQLIDLNHHQGEHPRIGATDVVPFVPLSGASMQDCIALARSLGDRVASELGIPVYLYEAAATRPERVNLENLRKGEYEGLKAAIESDPDRAPDFGPKRLGPAGATVIGARTPLIAYNVYLTTDDVQIAKKIASAIRQSSGGLPHVKALGMLVDGRAQVSMNLTNYPQTSIARVQEAIGHAAKELGVEIHHAELVGLVPQQALIDAARWHLQLDPFHSDQILENRLYSAAGASPEASFVDALADGTPTPGGGSAAAQAGAMAAALVAMVGRLTVGKKKYADVESRMEEIIDQAEGLRRSLQTAVEADSAAFDQVMAARRLPKGTTAEQTARASALEQATRRATEVPLSVAEQARQVLELACEVAETGNVNAASDSGSAGALARACLTAAGLNVQINASGLEDRAMAQAWMQVLEELERGAGEAEDRLRQAIHDRAGLGG
ncbi:MAG: glutamate formimidoyltransferase [Anaerolineales bacterium]|nr:glutamate formimidoyltransferase [Anaerolineales bacterium]